MRGAAANVVRFPGAEKLNRHQRRVARAAINAIGGIDRPVGWCVVLWDQSGMDWIATHNPSRGVAPRCIAGFVGSVMQTVLERDGLEAGDEL